MFEGAVGKYTNCFLNIKSDYYDDDLATLNFIKCHWYSRAIKGLCNGFRLKRSLGRTNLRNGYRTECEYPIYYKLLWNNLFGEEKLGGMNVMILFELLKLSRIYSTKKPSKLIAARWREWREFTSNRTT